MFSRFIQLSLAFSGFALLATALPSCSSGDLSEPAGGAGLGSTQAGSTGLPGSGGAAATPGGGAANVSGNGQVPGGGNGNNSTGGNGSTAGNAAGGSATVCTNIQHPDHQDKPCSYWVEDAAASDECNNPNGWLDDYCNESCGRCSSGNGGSGNDGGQSNGGQSNGGQSNNGGSNNNTGGDLGNDNPWGNVTGGQDGWASRYWDCCKQSCGWKSGNPGNSQNPVNSCGQSGENVVGDGDASACDGGGATTCNSFVPWAHSNVVSFGFVATHGGSGVPCGTCYQIQFTGTGHNGNDPGSVALKDKVMIVMATNIGFDVSGGGQMDLLLPGGGVGQRYGCSGPWGIQNKSDPLLGAEFGGLRAGCGGDLSSIKTCVKNKCQALFGSRNLPDMHAGCLWYADWFQAADNPNFKYKQVTCPSQLTNAAY
jgi:hypothetical protein